MDKRTDGRPDKGDQHRSGDFHRFLPNYLGWCHALHVARVDAPASLLKSALGWRGGKAPGC